MLAKNFKRSPNLPFPLGYKNKNQNPVLECLADQTRFDPGWSHKKFKGEDLLREIIEALENKKIKWPIHMEEFITRNKGTKKSYCEKWIQCMIHNPTFYINSSRPEYLANENILLILVSRYLNRTIKLISFSNNEDPKIISEISYFGIKNRSKVCYFLHLRIRYWIDKFCLSIIPSDDNHCFDEKNCDFMNLFVILAVIAVFAAYIFYKILMGYYTKHNLLRF